MQCTLIHGGATIHATRYDDNQYHKQDVMIENNK